MEAERRAVQWCLELRTKLFQVSEARPLEPGDTTSYNQWQESFMFSEHARVQDPQQSGSRRGGVNPNKDSSKWCLWYQFYKCSNKSCDEMHGCPWCGGEECHNREAPLAYHLSRMRTPQVIVPESSASVRRAGFGRGQATGAFLPAGQHRRNSPGRDRRRPSRSRSPRRQAGERRQELGGRNW